MFTSVSKNRMNAMNLTFHRALGLGFCVSYFLLILSDVLSLEKLSHFEKKKILNDKIVLQKSHLTLGNLAKLVFWSILSYKIFFSFSCEWKWDGDFLWTVNSRGHFFFKMQANSRGYFLRVNFGGLFCPREFLFLD